MFENKKVAIWGLGVEGQAVLQFLNKEYPNLKPTIIDDDKVPDGVDIIVRSPGVSIYRDDIKKAKEDGVKFTSLLNIFLERLNKQKNKPTVIAITGTKGKSTTVSVLAFMLEQLGYKVGLGGNIGKTPLDFLGQNLDFIVLELSSFQISDLEQSVDVGVVINLSRAHVDWHITLDNYFNDKLRLLDLAKYKILNYQDERLAKLDADMFYNKEGGFYFKNGKIYDQGTALELPKLQIMGDHNLSNICAALSVLKHLELDYKKALTTLSDFESLEHRLQKVYEKNGYMFVDDSIATVPESVMAAIDAFKDKNVALIIGGYDNKNMDYTKINEWIEKSPQVKAALCLPDTGAMVKTSKSVPVKNMAEAVTEAVKRIEGGVVLLSPAAQSFNMYKNYKERGNDFARIAKEIM
jgi:UDP-N-acetylmuramoylalanine--D-glutamate ligase